ncbi:hypothetical protein D3C76_969950 [compost metagenome]
MVLEPGLEAHTGQALGDELQFAVFAAGVVHLDQCAVQRQGRGVEMARVFLGGVHVEQGQGVMIGFGDQVEGFSPGFFIDDDRQDLGREEGAVVNRNDVDLVRQVLAGQGQALAGGVVFGGLRVGVFAGVFGECLLVAHGAPAQWSMGLRWGRPWVVSMGEGIFGERSGSGQVLAICPLQAWRADQVGQRSHGMGTLLRDVRGEFRSSCRPAPGSRSRACPCCAWRCNRRSSPGCGTGARGFLRCPGCRGS